MNALLVLAGIVLFFATFVFIKIIRSEAYVGRYCLILFQNQQQKILSSIKLDSRISELDPKENAHEKLTEVLQDHLWKKAKQLDEGFLQKKFYLDVIIEIGYIVWLIYFTNKNYDASKS